MTTDQKIDQLQRNIGMELVRATEAAATMAAQHLDRGELDTANVAAAKSMKDVLQTIEMDGMVAIGEGGDASAPVLFHGDTAGTGQGIKTDIALDAIEGTPARTLHRPDALSLVAVADRGSMWNPGPIKYVYAIAVGQELRDRIDLTHDLRTNLSRISAALKCKIRDLNVLVLDRPRHADLVKQINACGARVKLHHGGFVAGAVLSGIPNTNVDVMISTGLANDAVLAAAAVKALGGAMEIRSDPQSDEEASAVRDQLGFRSELVLDQDDLIRSSDVFVAATGITEGSLLHGVRFGRQGIETDSIVIHERTGSLRYVRGVLHRKHLARTTVQHDGEGG